MVTADSLTVTGTNVTLVWTKGSNTSVPTYNTNHVRFFANSDLTIASEKYNIASVEFTYVTGRDPKKQSATYTMTPDTYTYDYDTNILTGTGSKSVTIRTTKQTRISKIKVVFENTGTDPEPIDIHDNYVMMPTVKVTDWSQLPTAKHPNYIYYVNSESTIGQDPTDVNVVLVGGASTISYAITVNDGHPFENVMAYHCAAWYDHKYTEHQQALYMPFDFPLPDAESNNLKLCTFEGIQGDAFSFVSVTEAKAYTPYLVVAEAQSDSVTVYDAGFSIRNMPITPENPGKLTVGDYTFCGTNLGLKADAMVAGVTYYVPDGDKWVKATGDIAPLTSYITTTLTSAPDSFNVKVDGTPLEELFVVNAIENVKENAASDGRVYTIDGKYVGNDANKLPRGIYVIDGKKVVK